MAITSGVRHFVMAITSAEAMARHTAFRDGHHIGPDVTTTGLIRHNFYVFFQLSAQRASEDRHSGGTAKPARLRSTASDANGANDARSFRCTRPADNRRVNRAGRRERLTRQMPHTGRG